jgi:cellulose 1,4-beta-cellobiosidase
MFLLAGLVASVGIATNQAENHPKLNWQQCSGKGSCTTQQGEVVMDSNWRWTHDGNGKNCYDGNQWIKDFCTENEACSKKCKLDGADYTGTYGVNTNGTALTLKFVTHGSYSTNIGSRVYLMKSTDAYAMFKLSGQEFTFSTDVSNLPCGLNGALYFVEMEADGGKASHPLAEAGAKYGLGYCDAQCPTDMKFIDGLANCEGWKPSKNDQNAGNGRYGTCCNEMDIWEANSQATAYTPHICDVSKPTRCDGKKCGENGGGGRYDGLCDQDGCDFNSWRMGNKSFFGPGMMVDSKKAMTVVTQFVGSGSSVSEIRRKYVQGGKTIDNSYTEVEGIKRTNSISDQFCKDQKKVFGDRDDFGNRGGFTKLAGSLSRGMVLALSLWDDHSVNMLWLDSTYPTNKGGQPGTSRGPCATNSGDPKDVESKSADASVVYGNIKFGPIDSTY